MKKSLKRAFSSPVTALAVVLGTAGVLTGICTATAHNIVFGAMALSLAYVNHKVELKEDIK
jgi:hypothetical protein